VNLSFLDKGALKRLFFIKINMAIGKQLNEKRNEAIMEDFASLWGSGLREELIYPQLSEKYYLSLSTLYRIVLAHSKKQKKGEQQ
jgi:Mor family transcriptional regulator